MATVSTDPDSHRIYAFGKFSLDVDRGVLLRDEKEIKLRLQAYEVLRILVEQHGRLVSRETLVSQVWGRKAVSDDCLTHCLIDIRKALGDRSKTLIRTVPRRGFILDVPVRGPGDDAGARRRSRPYGFAAAGLAAVLLAGLTVWLQAEAPGTSSPLEAETRLDTLAVLPFVDMSPEPGHEYLAEGIAGEILNLLAKAPDLRVLARASSFSLDEPELDTTRLATELGVTHVLQGSVRSGNDRIRVAAQLVETDSRSLLWSGSYDRDRNGALQVQAEIASAVAQALRVGLRPADIAEDPAPQAAAAHEAFLRARLFHHRGSEGDLERAERHYREAVALSPEHGPAWAGLAEIYEARLRHGSLETERAVLLQRDAVVRALQAGPELDEVHLRAGRYYQATGDFSSAARHFRIAAELNPNSPPVLATLAGDAAYERQFDTAIELQRRAVTLDPLSPGPRKALSWYLFAAGRLDEARRETATLRELHPASAADADEMLSCILILEGKLLEALPLVEQRRNADYRNLGYALVYEGLGRPALARRALQRLVVHPGFTSRVHLVEYYAYLGRIDEAFRWTAAVRRSLSTSAGGLAGADPALLLRSRTSPYLQSLQTDPRWQQWLETTDRSLLTHADASSAADRLTAGL